MVIKGTFVILVLLVLFAFSFAQQAPTQTSDTELIGAKAGMTPDNPLYTFKRWGEGIGMFFTFDDVAKAKLRYQYAKNRLAEATELQNNDKPELAEKTLEEYETELDSTTKDIENAKKAGKNVNAIEEEINEQNYQHALVLQKAHQKFKTEKGKAIAGKVFEKSIKKRADIASRSNDKNSRNTVDITLKVGKKSITLKVPEKFAGKFYKNAEEVTGKFKEMVEVNTKLKPKDAEKLRKYVKNRLSAKITSDEPCLPTLDAMTAKKKMEHIKESKQKVKKLVKKVIKQKKEGKELRSTEEATKPGKGKGNDKDDKGGKKGSITTTEIEQEDDEEFETVEILENETGGNVTDMNDTNDLPPCTNDNTGNETDMNDTNKTSTCPVPKVGDQRGGKKTTICHIPPGNPSNMHTIVIGTPAVPAHLRHGDVLGSCTCAFKDNETDGNDTGMNETDGNETDMNDTNETQMFADLSVVSIILDPAMINENGSVNITVDVSNLGNENATNYTVNILDTTTNSTIADEIIALTNVGETSVVSVIYSNVTGIGNHTIVVTADSTGVIEESDELNNELDSELEVIAANQEENST